MRAPSLLAVLALIIGPAAARGDLIAGWDFAGVVSGAALPATSAAPFVSVGDLTLGTGMTNQVTGPDRWGGAGLDAGSLADAITAGD